MDAGFLDSAVSTEMLLAAPDFEEAAGLDNSAQRRTFEKVGSEGGRRSACIHTSHC